MPSSRPIPDMGGSRRASRPCPAHYTRSPGGRSGGLSGGKGAQRLVECCDQAVEIGLRDVERRLDADDLRLVESVGDEDPPRVEPLGEYAALRLIMHLDADQEPLAAHLADRLGV